MYHRFTTSQFNASVDFLQDLVAVLLRRHPGVLLEQPGKIAHVFDAALTGHLVDFPAHVCQKPLGPLHTLLIEEAHKPGSRLLLESGGQIIFEFLFRNL